MSINNERRAALAKGARFLAGGAIGTAVAGQAVASQMTVGANAALPQLAKYAGDYAKKSTYAINDYPPNAAPDPIWEKRREAEDQIYKARAQRDEKTNRRFALRQDAAIDEDLAALKSVSPWWRRQVMADRYAAQCTIQEQWEEKIRKLREAPGHMLDKMLSEFLAELSQ